MYRYEFMRYPGGLCKAVTLSYDDGAAADARLAETLNRYGLKCTFNLLSSRVQSEDGLKKEFIRTEILAKGHEIATHGDHHRGLDVARSIEGIRDTLDCRLGLEKEFGIIVRGMAFPDRTVNKAKSPEAYARIRPFLEELDIVYARTTGGDNNAFGLPEDFMRIAFDGIRNGGNSIVFISDRATKEALMNIGISKEDADEYVVVGCYDGKRHGEWCGYFYGGWFASYWCICSRERYIKRYDYRF